MAGFFPPRGPGLPPAHGQASFLRLHQTSGCPIPVTALTASACLFATCGVALLDDALFMVVVLTTSATGLVAFGVARLLAAAPGRR
ncbi:protein of unknown function [Beijerinckiaceae bacterium RH AL1]|nr:protein of unknown function [Beijerinckiaceae bacterium RH CH11]VVB47313.1 protein of unknown function [Beijerinckiaceae bacterium RH AL8]VVC55781.1 protein of unknown function [Beijerinckiaceae bacterium RH AL1]